MFPIVAIGGVIGAVFSVAKGASWLADQLDSSKSTASVGGKGEAKPATSEAATKASPFEAALSAQVAGQTLPASPSAASVPVLHAPDYDASARIKAGVVAYNHIGEHRGNHGKPHPAAGSDNDVVQT